MKQCNNFDSMFKKIRMTGLFLIVLCFVCCEEYDTTTTEFYVKNTSQKTITFDASIIKPSQLSGPYEVSLSFTVNANDSVLARKAQFNRDGKNPQNWFHTFVIHPVEGVQMNDPNLSENWIKYDVNVMPIYVFTLNKN